MDIVTTNFVDGKLHKTTDELMFENRAGLTVTVPRGKVLSQPPEWDAAAEIIKEKQNETH